MKQNIRNWTLKFMASGLGLGLCPIAPGSFGALVGVALHILVCVLLPEQIQFIILSFLFLLVCYGNNILTPWAQEYWGGKDPKHFVLDEVAGYLLVALLLWGNRLIGTVLAGFILFRVFDIIKLPIARQIDRKGHGAWSILLDDLVAAVYTSGCLYMLKWLAALSNSETLKRLLAFIFNS